MMLTAIGLFLAILGTALAFWADWELDLHRPFTSKVLGCFAAACLIVCMVAVVAAS